MRAGFIFTIMALATSTYAVAVPTSMTGFDSEKLSAAIKHRRDTGVSSAIATSNIFARDCTAAYCDHHSDCTIYVGCHSCGGSTCSSARPPAPAPPPSPPPSPQSAGHKAGKANVVHKTSKATKLTTGH